MEIEKGRMFQKLCKFYERGGDHLKSKKDGERKFVQSGTKIVGRR
jgi:hypothetical protein